MFEQNFTVFVDASDGWKGYCNRDGVKTLEGMIAAAVEREKDWPASFTPVAWMYGKTTNCDYERQLSIAAGRVIKLIDGKYVAFGTEDTFHCAPETLNPPEPVADECEPEKVRPALTWNTPARIDRFPADWSYSSDTATPDHAYSHPLTRVADAGAQTNPVCGSAWLVVR